MRLIRSIVLLSVVVATGLISQVKNSAADSLAQSQHDRLYTMPEFVVSATRWQVNVQQLPSSATVLTSADLLGANGSTLENALEGVPGLFLKSYGGPGAVTTSSIRGMGAEHTLVLIDGQRYNNVLDGQVDLGVFLMQNVDRVEVLRGGFSSVYGADAVGGIINIITRRPDGKLDVRAELGAGSYGMSGFQLGTDFSLFGVGMQVAAKREAGKGDYEFDFNDGISSNLLRRQNSDYALHQVQLLAGALLSPNLNLRASSMYDWAERGSPGAVVTAASYAMGRLVDRGFLNQATLEWTVTPALLARFPLLFHSQRREYSNPLAEVADGNDDAVYNDRTIAFTPHVRYFLSSSAAIDAGAEYSRSSVSSNKVLGSTREQAGVFVSSDHVVEFQNSLVYQLNIYPSVRYDHFSDVSDAVNPRLGINVGLWRPSGLRLKASYAKSFKAPTFDDLYWKGGGNPLLRPERSLSFDAGVAISPSLIGALEIEVNYFDIRTHDRIVWSPDKSGFWSPKNLQDVRSSGVELITSWHLFEDRLILRGFYSIFDTRKTGSALADDQTLNKQLPYIPSETAGLSCSVSIGRTRLNVHHTFTGFRYSTEINDPRFVLSGFGKTDANVSVRITEEPFNADLRFEATNLFESRYELFPSYPMPLRNFALKILLDF
ncbi:MAG: TonB-dependent receptor [Ignavibacteriales bacterium]|nr:TonB-dependent receptor [Ignavibacteriales bacterium]